MTETKIKRIRVTIDGFQAKGGLTVTQTTRDFEGEVRWNCGENGNLIILKMDDGLGYGSVFIAFARGKWVSVEYIES